MKICLPLQFSVLLILFLHASNKHAHTRSSTLAHTHTHTQVDTLHHNAIRRLFAISSAAAADAAQHFGSFLSGFSGFFLSSFSHAFVFPLMPLLQVLRRALKPQRAAAELAQLPRLALLQFFAYADCDFPFLHFSLFFFYLPSTHFSFVRILTSILAWFKAIHKVHNGMANSTKNCAELRNCRCMSRDLQGDFKLRNFTEVAGE